MTQLGIGTATFVDGYGLAPNTPTHDAAAALLRQAFAAGIRYVDTAVGYGPAEAIVGRVSQDIVDCGVRVCTKISAVGDKPDALGTALRASLERLRLDRVDTVLLHS